MSVHEIHGSPTRTVKLSAEFSSPSIPYRYSPNGRAYRHTSGPVGVISSLVFSLPLAPPPQISPTKVASGGHHHISPTRIVSAFPSSGLKLLQAVEAPKISPLRKRTFEEYDQEQEDSHTQKEKIIRVIDFGITLPPSARGSRELFLASFRSIKSSTDVDKMIGRLFGEMHYFAKILELWNASTAHHETSRLLFWNVYERITSTTCSSTSGSSSSSSSSMPLFERAIQELLLHFANSTNVIKNHYTLISFDYSSSEGGGQTTYQMIAGYRREHHADAYLLMNSLGQGSQGKVIKISDIFSRRYFAFKKAHRAEDYWTTDETGLKDPNLKSSRPQEAAETAQRALLQEIHNLQQLGKNDCYQEYVTSFSINGTPCLVTPFYEGMELAKWYGQTPRPSGSDRILICKRIVLNVLKTLEEQYKIKKTRHGDIKTGNLMVGPDMSLKLIDWGGAAVQQEPGTFNLGQFTPGYLPQELLIALQEAKKKRDQEGWDRADERRDRTATGVMLCNILLRKSGKKLPSSIVVQKEKLATLGYSTRLISAIFSLCVPLAEPFVPFSAIEARWTEIDPTSDYTSPLLPSTSSCAKMVKKPPSLRSILEAPVPVEAAKPT